MSEQIAVRLPDDLAEALEELVDGGSYVSKAEAVRSAVQRLVEADRRRRIGEQIALGYATQPQAADDDLAEVAGASATRALRMLDAEDAGAGEW
jgi:Arc/MetJ-type ribon-helix-helix transcriptional regulator